MAWLTSSQAQVVTTITSDSTMGTGVTDAGGGVHEITGGTRSGGGTNLFHSFGEFSVATSDIANFLNDSALPTDNILGRVTGGNPSQIFGTVQTTGFGNANLFFMNPAGLVFGPDATFNVGGVVSGTTANVISLEDGAQFFADSAQASVLSVAPVSAFGFLGENPPALPNELTAAVTIKGMDARPTSGVVIVSRSGLVGGEGVPGIRVTGTLQTAGSPVSLVSVDAPGEVVLTSGASVPTEIDVASFARLGDVFLKEGTRIQTTGNPFKPQGGPVFIRGNEIGGNDVRINTRPFVFSSGRAGDIVLLASGHLLFIDSVIDAGSIFAREAGSITLHGSIVELQSTLVNTFSLFGSNGAGAISIRGDQSILLDKTRIESDAFFAQAGPIFLDAPFIELNHSRVDATVRRGFRNGGDILVTADNLRLVNSGISSGVDFGAGIGGMITLNVEETVNIIGFEGFGITTTATGSGDAGNIEIYTTNLNVLDGGRVSSDHVGPGEGGTVRINASGSVLVSGVSEGIVEGVPSLISAQTTGNGIGGTIEIKAESFRITNGGQVTTAADEGGIGGSIDLEASTLIGIQGKGSGIVSTADGAGNGGDINLNATSLIELIDGATISAKSTSTDPASAGDAGNIVLTSGGAIKLTKSSVTAESLQASGGNITLKAAESIHLVDSQITSSVQGGETTAGGNITLDPPLIVLQNSQILATAIAGQGGNITLVGDVVLIDPSSVLDASSQLGVDGSVDIRGPVTNLAESLSVLPESVLQAAALLREACAARVSGEASSLVVGGRGIIPGEPGGWLASGPLFETPALDAALQSRSSGGGLWQNGLQGETALVSAGCS